MPHLSPMSWIYFLLMMWLCMLLTITNMWWFLLKPSTSFIDNMLNMKKSNLWKW
uniref:ATP synthase F0 subunit 8 n=1 Tax=Batracobdella cancricola TaxID=3027018 RepID=UPI0023D82ACA|nr:ATP synthase F0 subunit 8 [Batracobdella cancricola]WDA96152.1 ATP synthase F0 subunit 8 [Batracobdella cancricola]